MDLSQIFGRNIAEYLTLRQSDTLMSLRSGEVEAAVENSQRNENKDMEPELSLEKAEEILRNVYQAVGIVPPENCSEILRRGKRKESLDGRMPVTGV